VIYGEDGSQIRRPTGSALEEDRAAAAPRAAQAAGRPSASSGPHGDGGHRVPVEDRVSVEGIAQRVRLGLDVSSATAPVVRGWRVRENLC